MRNPQIFVKYNTNNDPTAVGSTMADYSSTQNRNNRESKRPNANEISKRISKMSFASNSQ